MRTEMTENQLAKAEKVREIFNIQEFSDVFTALDFSDAMGLVLDGVDGLENPDIMQAKFVHAWKQYAMVWIVECNAALKVAVGSDDRWEQMKSHPEGITIGQRILERISTDGRISKRMEVTTKVDDILAEYGIN
jgi:hypothetical protein